MAERGEHREGNGFTAEVIRARRRKSVAIRVRAGAVSIVVPVSTRVEEIDQLLVAKSRWIKEKITLQRGMTPVRDRQFISGEAFPYLGRNYHLKVECGPFAPVKLAQGRLLVCMPDDRQQHLIRSALVRWYKRQAEQKLREKVSHFVSLVGAEPTAVRIKTFKARWGSCTAQGELEFNWKIMLAPNRMVDYVVIHELCHLIRHDHSPQFWREVARVMPDYPQCREWLRANTSQLLI